MSKSKGLGSWLGGRYAVAVGSLVGCKLKGNALERLNDCKIGTPIHVHSVQVKGELVRQLEQFNNSWQDHKELFKVSYPIKC